MNMKKILTTSFLIVFAFAMMAQESYSFVDGTTCTIKGTSTIHDWTAKASELSGSMELDKSFTKKALPKVGATIESGSFKVAAKSIDGGKGSTMNDKIYAAFKHDQYPNITFKLSKAEVSSVNKSDQTFLMDVSGELSMAGTSKQVSFPMKGMKNDAGNYVLDGEKKIDMTAFNIEPPSAMFGQIETGKEITVVFHLIAKK